MFNKSSMWSKNWKCPVEEYNDQCYINNASLSAELIYNFSVFYKSNFTQSGLISNQWIKQLCMQVLRDLENIAFWTVYLYIKNAWIFDPFLCSE